MRYRLFFLLSTIFFIVTGLRAQYFQQFPSLTYSVRPDFADLNGDGKADTVLENGGIEVQLSGQSSATTYPLSSALFSGDTIAGPLLQDVNGDGKIDIVVPRGNGVDILLNKGDGTFEAAVPYITDDDFSTFAIADMNGDGTPDIIYIAGDEFSASLFGGQHAGTLAVALNTGSGYLKSTYYTLAGSPESLATGDLNGDGKPDVVVAGGESDTYTGMPVTYLLNNGTGGLGTPQYIPTITNPQIGVGDLNGDGFADIVAMDRGEAVILQGNAAGNLSIGQRLYYGYTSAASFTIQDLNGDGHPDIFAGGSVSLNDGTGKFGAFTSYFNGGFNPRLADMNGDGYPDLVWDQDLPAAYATYPPSLTSQYALNNGNGTFSSPQSGSAPATVYADFNGDGLTDAASSDVSVYPPAYTVSFQISNGNGTFRHVRGPSVPGYILFAGDLNGDGRPDITSLNEYLSGTGTILQLAGCLNGGSLSFSCKSATTVATLSDYSTADPYLLADIGGNGYSSFLYISGATLFAATSKGDGTFSAARSILSGLSNVSNIFVSDFNKDGIPDILIVSTSQSVLYLGASSGKYTVAGSVPGQVVAVADFNNDTYPDVLLEESGSEAVLQPYLGSKQGTFTAGVAFTTDMPYYDPLAVTAGDVNGDGFPDVIYNSYGSAMELALNNGSGGFTQSQKSFGSGENFILAHENNQALSSKKLDLLTSYDGLDTTAMLNLGNAQTLVPAIPRIETNISSNPVTAGQQVTISVKATAATGTDTPQGTVTIWNNNTALATAPLTNGGVSLTFPTNGVPIGIYPLTASFQSSNTAFQSSDSTVINASLENSSSHNTLTSLSVNNEDVTAGSIVTVHAYVSTVAGAGVPAGSVSLQAYPQGSNSPISLGTATLSNGTGSLSLQVPSGTPEGFYYIAGQYSGASGYSPSTGSSLSDPNVYVQTPCSITLQNATTSGAPGDAITGTMAYNSQYGQPIMFLDGIRVSSGSEVDYPQLEYQFSGEVPDVPAGQHLLTAYVTRSGSFGACTSAPIAFTVN